MPEILDSFSGKHECFSNFSSHTVMYHSRLYSTSEHAFHTQKATNERDRLYIMGAPSPKIAKQRGRQIQLRSNWDELKDVIMLKINLEKFLQHRNIAEVLLSTENRILIEGNNWGDNYWGMIRNKEGKWEGKNKLGHILGIVREILRLKNLHAQVV